MKVYYQDGYGVNIHEHNTDAVPRVGEAVSFVDDDWYVKSVTWIIEEEAVVIVLSQQVIREIKEDVLKETVADLKKTVSGVVQSQQMQEKKTRQLREQIATLRQGINQRIYNESKK